MFARVQGEGFLEGLAAWCSSVLLSSLAPVGVGRMGGGAGGDAT